jgi:AmmeMemoRadiSam system protein B
MTLTFLLALAIFLPLPSSADGALRSPYDAAMSEAFSGFSRSVGDRAVVGGVVPHHDIAVGMMMRFYDRFPREVVRRVFLFAPDHFRRARRWAAVCPDDWDVSGGVLRADGDAVDFLRAMDIVEARSDLFASEHGITAHIPLLAGFFPGASVVPIVLRPDIPDVALLSLRAALGKILRDGDVVILSADLSHYKTPEEMAAEDRRTIKVLTRIWPAATGSIDIDARRAASLVMLLARDMGAVSGELVERADSSSILGKKVESGTSYATIIYRKIYKE